MAIQEKLTMNHAQPFSVLNEQLRPSSNTSTRLYSSLNRMEDRQMGSLSRRNLFYRPTVVPTEPKASLIQTEPKASLIQAEPKASLIQTEPKASLIQTEPKASLIQAEPKASLIQTEPKASLIQTEPKASLIQAEPKASLIQTEPKASLIQTEPKASLIQTEPKASLIQAEPKASLIQAEPKASLTQTEPEDPEEPESTSEDGDQVSDEGTFADLLKNSVLINELSLSDFGEDEPGDEDRRASEEEDQPGELNSEGTGDSESVSLDDEGRRPFQSSYINGALPDLINGGRPLSRRRTLGHVSDTLKEVRREVDLSRRRSIKLKAQVDKLQESREGPGWSQHREKVTEEVQSILKLLRQLTESESSPPEPPRGTNRLDASLAQLQTVACKLALSHNKQFKSGNGKGSEESAILQQALRDRDDAIEKKKAMEDELLRSKTDLMLLNNQLLEAVQKRLEQSLELENWKEDVQQMLHQQLQAQQQAEAEKKPSRLGILRRSNKPPIQRPNNFPMSTPVPPTTNSKQIFVPRSPPPQRHWMDKLRRPKSSRHEPDAVEPQPEGDKGFQVVSLD
ncbi:bicaudal-D-related protein 2-like [Pseudochaenichthys georgianus]|uniref:bicaudal-D-related protein 2-like n=1 Tax=Pseudochaenichthys georgianus TaxID=52239 RepID=UPI00146CD21E|nr:bicaudal-D-related protein 2-like [Pseudochaenichthys georgianus]